MGNHRVPRPRFIARNHGRDDRLMLDQRLPWPTRDHREAELVMNSAVSQIRNQHVGLVVLTGQPERLVQPGVQLAVTDDIALVHRDPHLSADRGKLSTFRFGRVARCSRSDEALQRAARLGDLNRFVDADAAHCGTAIRLTIDQVFAGQLGEGSANGRPAGGVTNTQVSLNQTRPRREDILEDFATECNRDCTVVDHIGDNTSREFDAQIEPRDRSRA